MKRWPIVLAVLVAHGAAAADAASWLARIGPALRETNYQGTLVYLTGPRVETFQVFHSYEDGIERERWVALTGPVREMLRDSRQLVSQGVGKKTVTYAFGQRGQWQSALAMAEVQALPHYRSVLAGNARVAGQVAQRIDVLAADTWRYGYQVWVDRASGLPLRLTVLDDSAQVVEQLAFTDIRIGQRPQASDLQPSQAVASGPRVEPKAEASVEPDWQVASLPEGFVLRRSQRSDAGLHLLYSDGLASFSVYVERLPTAEAGESMVRNGAINARSFWREGWRVVAVGKVPAATVERAARSVRASVPLR